VRIACSHFLLEEQRKLLQRVACEQFAMGAGETRGTVTESGEGKWGPVPSGWFPSAEQDKSRQDEIRKEAP
jgi:hypothetical protein